MFISQFQSSILFRDFLQIYRGKAQNSRKAGGGYDRTKSHIAYRPV